MFISCMQYSGKQPFSSYHINFSYTEWAITNGLEFDYISMLRPAEHIVFKGINRKPDTMTISAFFEPS